MQNEFSEYSFVSFTEETHLMDLLITLRPFNEHPLYLLPQIRFRISSCTRRRSAGFSRRKTASFISCSSSNEVFITVMFFFTTIGNLNVLIKSSPSKTRQYSSCFF